MGGRGGGSGIGPLRDWLKNEGGKAGGPVNPIDISKFQDWSLEQVENRIRNLAHEELFILDQDDNVVAAYKGDKDSVGLPSSWLSEPGITVTHGHPKGESDFGGTFSWADINNMLESNWAEHRATASGQGEMNYIMRRTASADSQGLRRQINTDYPRINQEWQDAYRRAYSEEKSKGASERQARHVARQKGVGVLNAYYRETFPKFGFEYTTRKKEYTYNR